MLNVGGRSVGRGRHTPGAGWRPRSRKVFDDGVLPNGGTGASQSRDARCCKRNARVWIIISALSLIALIVVAAVASETAPVVAIGETKKSLSTHALRSTRRRFCEELITPLLFAQDVPKSCAYVTASGNAVRF